MKLLDKVITKYILSEKVFYATLLTKLYKIPSTAVPTLAVSIQNGQIYLLYNEDFINEVAKKSTKHVEGLLEHELLHLVFEHISKAVAFNRIMPIYNIATDIAINQYIGKSNLPNGVLYPEMYNLPNDKDAEWYYNELLKRSKKIGMKDKSNKDGEDKNQSERIGGEPIDSHKEWYKGNKNSKLTKEIIKQAIKEAYDAHKKSRGHLPAGVEEMIEEQLKPPVIPWSRLFQQYVASNIKSGFKTSWKRPNRRLGEDIKGKTVKRTINILTAIDTSGSVSDKDFNDFISELKGILRVYKSKIKIIQCDAAVQDKCELKPYTKLKIKFKGRGGTSYKPVFDYLKQRPDIDLLIYFTDLYCDFKGCITNKPVIWVLSRNGDENNIPPFGRLVKIK